MVYVCAVAECKNNKKTKITRPSLIFHTFPKNPDVRNTWVNKCKRGDQLNPDNAAICSDHFIETDYERDLKHELLGLTPRRKLKSSAIPSVFLFPNEDKKGSKSRKDRLCQRNVLHVDVAAEDDEDGAIDLKLFPGELIIAEPLNNESPSQKNIICYDDFADQPQPKSTKPNDSSKQRLNIPILKPVRSEKEIKQNMAQIVENIVFNPENSHHKRATSNNYYFQQQNKINHPPITNIFNVVHVDCSPVGEDDVVDMKLFPGQFIDESQENESPSQNHIYYGDYVDQPKPSYSNSSKQSLFCDEQFNDDRSSLDSEPSWFSPEDPLSLNDPPEEIKFNLPPGVVLKDCFVKLEKLPKSSNAPHFEASRNPEIKQTGSKTNLIVTNKPEILTRDGMTNTSESNAPVSKIRFHVLPYQHKLKLMPLTKILLPNIVKPFQCTFGGPKKHCPCYFKTEADLIAHIDRVHTDFKCETCGAEFEKEEKLKTHKVLVHKEPHPFYCDFNGCNKGFMYSRTLADHKMLHTGDRPFHCDTCNAGYRTKEALHEHKLSHLPKDLPSCICDVCGKTFRSSMHLSKHRKYHTREKKYKCPQCPWAFQLPSLLQNHIAKHSEARPFLCQQCGVAFKYKNTLNNHLRIHKQKQTVRSRRMKGVECSTISTGTNNKKKYRYTIWHRCYHCPLKYKKLNELVQHLVSDHDEQPKFECETCRKTGFVTKLQVNLHKQTHKKATCPKCKKVYTARNKKQHLKHCPMMKSDDKISITKT